uniref:C-type lectin domain-containing protein n=1 Tax=Caenorhabditis japonica TaxID=281687 RepID=A0A8R1IB59_CAEJA
MNNQHNEHVSDTSIYGKKWKKEADVTSRSLKTPKITENHPPPPIHSAIAANLHENVETTNVEIEEELEILENSVQDSWNTSEAGTKYKLFDEAKSWNDAQLHCEEFGSHLAFLDSESKNQYSKELLHYYGIRHVWFGLRTDVEDVPGQAQDFSNFEGLNGCGVVDQNGVWSISACTMLLPYLCQAMRFDVFVEIA